MSSLVMHNLHGTWKTNANYKPSILHTIKKPMICINTKNIKIQNIKHILTCVTVTTPRLKSSVLFSNTVPSPRNRAMNRDC